MLAENRKKMFHPLHAATRPLRRDHSQRRLRPASPEDMDASVRLLPNKILSVGWFKQDSIRASGHRSDFD
jgi:hypothetical protein